MGNQGVEEARNKSANCDSTKLTEKGHIQNAFVCLDRNHRLAWRIMEEMAATFTNKSERAALGPVLTSNTIKKLYNITNFSRFKGADLEVLPVSSFLPIGCNKANDLWNYEAHQDWDEVFKCSYAVHFFSYLTSKKPIRKELQHEAYSYLGPKHCPISYWSTDKF